MEFSVQLVIMFICGVIASLIAHTKGRSEIGWFFGGFFLGLIGVIIIAVLPNLKDQKAKEVRIELENRRLREQLNQERLKIEAFRRHTTARLDLHDESLGIDTRHQLPDGGVHPGHLLESMGQASLTGGLDDEPIPLGEEDELTPLAPRMRLPVAPASQVLDGSGTGVRPSRLWHYELGGAVVGPVDERRLLELFNRKELHGGTLVWTEGLGEWTPAERIRGLRAHVKP